MEDSSNRFRREPWNKDRLGVWAIRARVRLQVAPG